MNLDQIEAFQCSEETLKKFDLQVKDKKELVNLVNESIFRKCAKTNKEKFELLDLRDKILKLIRYETNLKNDTETTLYGTCEDMCPEKERYSREYLSLYHRYEIHREYASVFDTVGTEIVDHRLMIKEYSRSSADQDLPLPNEMRPIRVLYGTMMYLIDEVISKIGSFNEIDDTETNEFSIGDWYDFVWNRTRSIRKDIIQQRLLLNGIHAQNDDGNNILQSGLGGLVIIEQCARFHIMCAHRLCEESSQVFDFKINEENLKNCFQSLRQYYEYNPTLVKASPCEAEFRSYGILLNLSESNILCEIQRWPQHIRHSEHVRFALNIYFAYNSRNYVKFFRLIRSDKCLYLHACILHRYFYKIRCEAFKTIFTAFRDNKEKIFPLARLVTILGFDDEDEAYDYCNLFGLDVCDDSNVLMRSSMKYDCFHLKKSEEDRLKGRRSRLLVESKFEKRKIQATDSSGRSLTGDECLSEIISGQSFADGTKQPSEFGIKSPESGIWHTLHSSFDEEGHYSSDEIEQLLNLAKQSLSVSSLKKVAISNRKTTALSNKPTSKKTQDKPSVAIFKRATSIVRKAQQQSIKNNQKISPTADGSKIKQRTKSSSSTSSNSSSKDLNIFKNVVDSSSEKSTKVTETLKPSLFQMKTPLISQSNEILKAYQNSAQPSLAGFNVFGKMSAPVPSATAPSSLFSRLGPQIPAQPGTNPFQVIAQKKLQSQEIQPPPPVPTSIFNTRLTESKNLFANIPQSKTDEPKNFFANIIKKNEPQSLTQEDLKSRDLNAKCEQYFQQLLLEHVKTTCSDFLFIEKKLPDELAASLINDVTETMCNSTALDEINTFKQQKLKFEEMKKKELEINQMRLQQLNSKSEEIYNSLLISVIEKTCEDFLNAHKQYETLIYDEILMSLFQREFEIILKQISNEINNEILIEKLAESVYFNWNENALVPIEEAYPEMESIFMNDLRSFMHECIYEFTRLNLNVNRELYFELKQSLILNQKIYLFRKWRLRLSVKLLSVAHRRTSLSLKSGSATNQQLSVEANNQLNLISFMKSYGLYLIENLSKLQKISSFLIPNSFYSYEYEYLLNNFELNYDFNMIKLPNYSIVHCEQYQMFATWNLSLNYKSFLYDLLLDNYFNIIRNKEKYLIIPPPMLPFHPTHQLISSPQASKEFLNFNPVALQTMNNELFIKTIVVLPSLHKKIPDDDECFGGIKRWLLSKFFHFNSKKMNYETKLLESLCVNNLKTSKFSIKFCIKHCSDSMSKSEIKKKLNQRSLYGSNSMVFVLMPFSQIPESGNEDDELKEYINKNRESFFQILSLFNENIKLNEENTMQTLNSYEFLFISYLDGNEKTKNVIEKIFGTNQLENYCYCLLEGDAIKDNGILQRTYQFFLQKVCLKYARLNFAPKTFSLRYEQINNIATLTDLFEITCNKFLDFLANHPLKNSIYLRLKDLIREYNHRIERFLKILTNENYKNLTWPIPEMIDFELNLNESSNGDEKLKEANTLWTLKYWNSNECFDTLLNKQFFNLIKLEEFSNDFELDSSNELIDFSQIEQCVFRYLSLVLKSKRSLNILEVDNEINSVFQLENRIENILKNMKKTFILTQSSFSTDQVKNLLKVDQKSTLLVKKSCIEWSKLLLPIVEYLLSNGVLKFKNVDKIYSNQFYIYYNLNEIKGYDWINNCIQIQSTPPSTNSSTSSLSNFISPIQSNYLVKTYPRKFEDLENVFTHKNHKRRLSEDLSSILDHHQKSDSDDGESSLENTHHNYSLTEQVNFANDSPIDGPKSVKLFKRRLGSPLDKMKTSPKNLNSIVRGEHENKLNEFISLLQTEKENNFQFENRLIKLQSTTPNEKLIEKDESKKTSALNEDSKKLEVFLEKINQEKLKNEEFNLKLDQMLNYAKF